MSLHSDIGGDEGIKKLVVNQLYPRILAQPELAKMFKNTDMPKQHSMMIKMLSMATGGGLKYNGRGMKKAHAGLGITNHHFDLVAAALIGSMKAEGWSQDSRDKILSVVSPMREDIVSGVNSVVSA